MPDLLSDFAHHPAGIVILSVVGVSLLALFVVWYVSVCRLSVEVTRLVFVFFFGKPWAVIYGREIYLRYPRVFGLFTIEPPEEDPLGYDTQGQRIADTLKFTCSDGIPVEVDFSVFARVRIDSEEACWTWYLYADKDIERGVLDRVSGILTALAGVLNNDEFRSHISQINAYLRLRLLFKDQFRKAAGVAAEWDEFKNGSRHLKLMKLSEKPSVGESDIEQQFGIEFDSFVVSRIAYEKGYAESLEAKEKAKLDGDAKVIEAGKAAEVLAIQAGAAKDAATKKLEGFDAWLQRCGGDMTAALAAYQSATGDHSTVTVQDLRGAKFAIAQAPKQG